jgi:hypothetical protein
MLNLPFSKNLLVPCTVGANVGTSLLNRVESRKLLGEGPSEKAGERRPPERTDGRRSPGEG